MVIIIGFPLLVIVVGAILMLYANQTSTFGRLATLASFVFIFGGIGALILSLVVAPALHLFFASDLVVGLGFMAAYLAGGLAGGVYGVFATIRLLSNENSDFLSGGQESK